MVKKISFVIFLLQQNQQILHGICRIFYNYKEFIFCIVFGRIQNGMFRGIHFSNGICKKCAFKYAISRLIYQANWFNYNQFIINWCLKQIMKYTVVSTKLQQHIKLFDLIVKRENFDFIKIHLMKKFPIQCFMDKLHFIFFKLANFELCILFKFLKIL